MKDLKDLTLRELVEQVADCLRRDTTVTGLKVLQELERCLPEIEAAVEHAEESGLHSETCCCACCELLRAYRAAKAERRGDAN